MNSAIYVGHVRHSRRSPVGHDLTVPLYMLYLDLTEIDTVFEGSALWSTTRWAPAQYRRSDFHGPRTEPLADSIRNLVENETGLRPTGAVRLLANIRIWGHVFNPAAFYYCFDVDETLHSVVTEITNTPWKERHTYVVTRDQGKSEEDPLMRTFDKAFHVSPFMDMNLTYQWRFTTPGERLIVHMENLEHARRIFHATLRLDRRPLTPRALNRLLFRYPFMTTRVVAGIHAHACRLWLKGCRFYPHPRSRRNRDGAQQ